MNRRLTLLALTLGVAGGFRTDAAAQQPEPTPTENRTVAARENMVRAIEYELRDTARETGVSSLSPCVRRSIASVPRERFVPTNLTQFAYENRPLPIGDGQTISQPFIVALMTELLRPKAGDRVLEVGTGSGYQAAVLAECVTKVYSIEIIPALAQRARLALDSAGYRNVETRVGDGYLGWPEAAPFDGIIVTAAPDRVPQQLVSQLKPGARMVIPVGPRAPSQQLLVIEVGADGRVNTQRTIDVRFVPLVPAGR
jgi:protein-L-isoaspartate(D-aspartate) O-methyltransferase